MTIQELTDWCIQNLSSKNKIISSNWTRNNFEYLKNRWPDMWKELNGKILLIKGKEFSFIEHNYKPLIINNIQYHNGGRTGYNKFIKALHLFVDNTKNYTLNDLIQYVFDNELTEGPCILRIIKKCWPYEYKNIMNKYSKKSENERETIYRYIHNITEKPEICGHPLKFHTYKIGYQGFGLYKKIKDKKYKNDIELLKLIYDGQVGCHGIRDLKKFFPHIVKKVKSLYNINDLSQCVYLYMNKMEDIPKCLYCKEHYCNWSGSFKVGYKLFCSLKCKAYFLSIRKLKEKRLTEYDWKQYHKQVWRNTNLNYRKYEHIINPNNLQRGINKYHLDHITPIAYGFCENIEPEVIGHYKNLQMLTCKENLTKGTKFNIDHVNNVLLEIKNDKTTDNK